jgi:V/A-type H+-transporting ATPase subunit I
LKLVFLIAAIEIVGASVIGAINQWKSGHKWGILGEHGLGMILYIIGFYSTVMHFIAIDMQFLPALNFWGFYLLLVGLLLSFLEPIIAGVSHGHFSIEVIGEGFGGLLMTFVEGLANMFSFLRIAAFAIAHASLALAAHSMEPMMGPLGLVIMNVIALSFEFVSSSVQSLRLLYYELMGKFYNGQGKRFVPFRA